MNWVPHNPSKKIHGLGGPNFIKVNKKCIAKGIPMVEARAAEERRNKTLDKSCSEKTVADRYQRISPMDPSFTYGKECRPSTPIASVISGQYAAEEEVARCIEFNERQKKKIDNPKSKTVDRTKSTEGHALGAARRIEKMAQKEAEATHQREFFKLSKFKKINSRVGNTGLNRTQRNSADAPGKEEAPPSPSAEKEVNTQTE